MLAPEHTKQIAERIVRANSDFIGQLQSFGELSRGEAEKVLDYFTKKKMVKADYYMGVIRVKHGRYFDRDFLQSLE
jgi:deoxyribodipyrimidine photolyase-like uncharacterized protein